MQDKISKLKGYPSKYHYTRQYFPRAVEVKSMSYSYRTIATYPGKGERRDPRRIQGWF